MAVSKHPWYFETDCSREALAGRQLLERYLANHAREGSDLYAAVLVYGELVSNVIKHAPAGGVRIWLEPHQEKFALCINDAGTGFPQNEAPRRPDDAAESGRGLFIVEQICEEVSFGRAAHEGFVVRAVLPLHRR